MFTPQAIGFVSSPFKNTREIPKGLGAKHDQEGALKILPEFELGLTDIEDRHGHAVLPEAFRWVASAHPSGALSLGAALCS